MIHAQVLPKDRILREIDRRNGYVRDRDIRNAGIDPHLLARLVEEGTLERVARGLYRRADAWSEYRSLVDAVVAAPHAVICLLSALEYYGLTTTVPPEVYLAVPRKARPPRLAYPPVRVIRYNDLMFGYGIVEQTLPHSTVRVRMYSREKSIADAIHFAGHVGRDIGIEALREYMRQRDRNVDELLRAADACRVRARVTAYLEMVA